MTTSIQRLMSSASDSLHPKSTPGEIIRALALTASRQVSP
jgi:hypothetical protein